jgi:hypothetical protein
MQRQLVGAYRYALAGEPLPITETFAFSVRDHLIGGEGWSLTTMRTSQECQIELNATGRWEHYLLPGNWRRIVTTDLHIRTVAAQHVDGSSNPPTAVSRSFNDSTIPITSLLALAGSTLERLIASPNSPADQLITFDQPHVLLLSPDITSLGPSELPTPEGQVRGHGYSVNGHTAIVAGDGLLHAYECDGVTAWLVRAASAPSRA